jgi:hypothetical protein
VIIYSVGNEIHDTPQAEKAKRILSGLVAVAHAADPTRPVTQALFRPNVSHDYTMTASPTCSTWSAKLSRKGNSRRARAKAVAQNYRHGKHARPQPVDRRARPCTLRGAIFMDGH